MTEEEKKRAEKLAKMHEADSRTDLEMGHPIEVGKDPLIGAPAVAAQEEKVKSRLLSDHLDAVNQLSFVV